MLLPDKETVDLALKTVGYVDIVAKDCTLFIAPRPAYCDRGTYMVNVKSFNQIKMMIDGADFFPHYFFGFEAMISEIEAWLRKRGQWK